MDKEKFKKYSQRRVLLSKCEKRNLETRNWWERLFKIMEEDAAIPVYERIEVLHYVYPRKILQRILDMMFFVEEETPRAKPARILGSTNELQQVVAEKSASVISLKSGEENRPFKEDELHEQLRKTFAEKKEVGPNNPYVKFFQRPKENAAIWRTIPLPPVKQMTLTQKSRVLTELIATDFVRWLRKLEQQKTSTESSGEEAGQMDVSSVKKIFKEAFGRSDSTNLGAKSSQKLNKLSDDKQKHQIKEPQVRDVMIPEIMKMFEINVNNEVARSLVVSVKEISAVSKSIAENRHLLKKFKNRVVHRHLHSDLQRGKKKANLVAFGKCLPLELRYTPPSTKYTHKWYEMHHYEENIASFSLIWDGITNLRSTEGYCRWLIEHPEVTPPKYLVDSGMLDPKVLETLLAVQSQTRISSDSIEVPFQIIDTSFKIDNIKRKEHQAHSNDDDN